MSRTPAQRTDAPTLGLRTAMRSVTGPHRRVNQDSVGAGAGFVFVADGVGGHVGGDVASWTLTHRLLATLATSWGRTLDVEALRGVLADANADIGLRVRRDPHLRGMATTFTGLFAGDAAIRVAHIGDSRALLVRDGQGRRVTRDDSLVQMLVDAGTISEADADHHPNRNVILRSFTGAPTDAGELTVLSVPAQVGDRWLVASDGLTDYVPQDRIVEVLVAARSPEAAAEALLQAALDADSGDNISLAVSDVVELPAGQDRRRVEALGAAADPAQGYLGDLTSRPTPEGSGR